MTVIPDWLDVAARVRGDIPALEFDGRTWTYAALRAHADAAARQLQRDVSPPLRLGILSANRPGVVIAIHAARRAGIEIVPLNWRLAPPELAFQVATAKVSAIVADAERMAGAIALSDQQSVAVRDVEELEDISAATESQPVDRELNLEAGALVMFTSGTSGRPKGARLTVGNLWHSAIASALFLGHQRDDRWLAALPLFHIGGLSIAIRSCIGMIPMALQDQFDPERTLHAIGNGASLVSLVPAMLSPMLEIERGKHWPRTLRCVLLGGSAAPPALVAECVRRGIPIAPTYGLTEAASQVTTLLPENVAARPGSSGLPLPTTRVRIGDASTELAAGVVGQIEVRGPTLFSGYLDDADRRTGWSPDGWFQTGDVGFFDDEGHLFVVDRRDDLIVSGGENVYPAEIERVLCEHPSVVDAGVYRVEDERWGQRPIACVVWDGDRTDAERALRAYCEARLGSFKAPDAFRLMSALPRSPSGKLLRRELPSIN